VVLLGMPKLMCRHCDRGDRGLLRYRRRELEDLIARVVVVGKCAAGALQAHMIQPAGADQLIGSVLAGQPQVITYLAVFPIGRIHVDLGDHRK